MTMFEPGKTRRILLTAAIVIGVAVASFQIYLFEPTDSLRCETVEVVSFRFGGKGSQWFTVVSSKSARELEVGASSAPFGRDYRGPATLGARRGHWTGRDHLRLYTACPVPADR